MPERRVFCGHCGQNLSARQARRHRQAERHRAQERAEEQSIITRKKAQIRSKILRRSSSLSSNVSYDSDSASEPVEDPPQTDSDHFYFDDEPMSFGDDSVPPQDTQVETTIRQEDSASVSGSQDDALNEEEELVYDADSWDDIANPPSSQNEVDATPFQDDLADERHLDSFRAHSPDRLLDMQLPDTSPDDHPLDQTPEFNRLRLRMEQNLQSCCEWFLKFSCRFLTFHPVDAGLDNKEMDNVIAFALRLHSMSRTQFEFFRAGYSDRLEVETEYKMYRLVETLSRLTPVKYDCCVDSCVLYAGEFADLDSCPYCQRSRYKTNYTGQTRKRVPRQTFSYIPIIPRLQALFHNRKMVETLSYRAEYDKRFHPNGDYNTIHDVFDSEHYRTLLKTEVTVNGKGLGYNHFPGRRDIAMGLSGDGVQVFDKAHRGTATCTPLLCLLYNLPPHIRTRLVYILALGVIPGPRGPKDMNSFFWPLKLELDKLAEGVETYDASEDELFILRAFLVYVLGDIPWVTKAMCIKGTNAKCPCRMCYIHGIRDASKKHGGVYYIPLTVPRSLRESNQALSYDVSNLPLRQSHEFVSGWAHICSGRTKGEQEKRKMALGLSGLSIFTTISSIDMVHSFPYEGMHLFFENIFDNFIKLWKGTFKGIPAAPWVMEEAVWERIGMETERAVRTIPASFVGKIPNIHIDYNLYKAEYTSFWFLYLAPALLFERLPARYYAHAIQLIRIVKSCLHLEMTRDQVDAIRSSIIEWGKEYER